MINTFSVNVRPRGCPLQIDVKRVSTAKGARTPSKMLYLHPEP
jgi:hypothetical protein